MASSPVARWTRSRSSTARGGRTAFRFRRFQAVQTWTDPNFAALMSGSPASKVRGMHTTLVQRHQSSFKTDGKHKHGMFTGANIAKLKQSTVQALVQHAELREVLRDLTYDWFGFDRGRTTNRASV